MGTTLVKSLFVAEKLRETHSNLQTLKGDF
jgi:hypothetical protein